MHIAYFMPAADERLRYISGEWGRYLERVTSVIQLSVTSVIQHSVTLTVWYITDNSH